MTPDERAALDRQRRIARTPPLAIERHEPLDGQGSFLDVIDQDLSPDQVRRALEWARNNPQGVLCACGTPIVRRRGRWACPKCAGIEEE